MMDRIYEVTYRRLEERKTYQYYLQFSTEETAVNWAINLMVSGITWCRVRVRSHVYGRWRRLVEY